MITLEQGESSPYLLIDTTNLKMILKGNSFVSNPQQLYHDMVSWVKSFKVPATQLFSVEITMGYYSTSNIQLLNLFLKTLHLNNPGQVDLKFFILEDEEEDLEETVLSLIFNTGIEAKRLFL
jgi:hypothetical protein